MKFLKYSLIAAIALSGCMAACSDDDDYAVGESKQGVFFPAGNPDELTLSAKAPSFEITVARTDASAEQTFTLTNNFAANTFTMPATVTFATGEEEKDVTVSYDPDLAPGDYNIVIGFAEGQEVANVGFSTVEITAVMPVPVPWKQLGECTFTDPFVTAGAYGDELTGPLKYKVEIEESGETPGLYRLVAPYGTAFANAFKEAFGEELDADMYDSANEGYLTIHAENPKYTYIMPQYIGVTMSSVDGAMIGMNEAGYYIAGGNSFDAVVAQAASSFAVFKDGILKLPAKNGLLSFVNAEGPYYANMDGAIKMIVMPGVSAGDYSASINYLGQFVNPTTGESSAMATFEFGKDVVSAKAALSTTGDANSLAAAIIGGTAANIVDVNMAAGAQNSFPVVMGGTQTLVVVTYDDGGEAQETVSTTFDMNLFNDDAAWTSLGTGLLADGWITGVFFVDDPLTAAWEVEVQESKTTPGIYRLIKPWNTATCPILSYNQSKSQADLYIDATDPEFIRIMPQASGYADFEPMTNGHVLGNFFVANVEGYFNSRGFSKAQIVANDMVMTSMEDGMLVVQLPYLDCDGGIPARDPETGEIKNTHWGAFCQLSALLFPDALDEGGEAAVSGKRLKAASKAMSNRPFRSSFSIKKKFNVVRPHEYYRVNNLAF